jgi:hypothetical protein
MQHAGLALAAAAVFALPATAAQSSVLGRAAAVASLVPAQPAASVPGRGAVEQALQAVARASAEARQSASAAAAAADRIAALERAMDQLRQEAQYSRTEAEDLRGQLGRAELPLWIWLLGAVAAGLALLAVGLLRRLAVVNQSAQTAAASKPAPVAPHPPMSLSASDVEAAALNMPRTRPAPAWPPPAPLDVTNPQMTPRAEPRLPQAASPARSPADAPATPPSLVDPLPPRSEPGAPDHDVSIDELLDLEQQADFFVVLGQDDAAIELLVEHLRHTGGGGPLPYLKLLEIYRRRGDRGDYERTRARFNRRFNAYAPDWDIDLQTGRNLSDYAGVIPRLQQVWCRPLDSMAELEAMMFRKSQGELFDLPAYREILFLYALARDLLDRESAETGKVDLLLPLADGGEFSSTSPTPFLDIGRDVQRATGDFEDRPTAPVDLDLSFDGERVTSIFDALGESLARARLR